MEKDLESIKKEILYLDDDLSKTHISGVSEENIDDCMKTIIESNPNVDFVCTQYSKRDRRLYFYTDEAISTSKWGLKSLRTVKEITTIQEVLEEIKNIFLINEDETNSCISIYDADYIIPLLDVLTILREKENEYESLEKTYEKLIESAYRNRFHQTGHCFTSGFNHETKRLKMAFSTYRMGDYKYVEFYKKDGDLEAQKLEGYIDVEEILLASGNLISEVLDKYQEYDEFKLQRSNDIRPVNSRFKVDISNYGVALNTNGNNFSLNMKSYTTEPDYTCSSYNITALLDNKENELLRKIYVRIDECPDWMHGILYEKRKVALSKKREEAEAKKQQELKEREKENKRIKKLERKKHFKNIFSKKEK